jgi:hypothetical protein
VEVVSLAFVLPFVQPFAKSFVLALKLVAFVVPAIAEPIAAFSPNFFVFLAFSVFVVVFRALLSQVVE